MTVCLSNRLSGLNSCAKGKIELSQELWGNMFTPLKDPVLFATAKQDPMMQTVRWDNGADLAPEFLLTLLLKQQASKA